MIMSRTTSPLYAKFHKIQRGERFPALAHFLLRDALCIARTCWWLGGWLGVTRRSLCLIG